MKKNILLFFVACSLFMACSSFIPDEEAEKLKSYETDKDVIHDYIMLKDVKKNEFSLDKGTRVRIIITGGDEWVKVYAYKAEEDMLKSARVLILHLFDTDFPDKQFSSDFFNRKLAEVIQKADTVDDTRKNEKKPEKKKGKKK